MPGKSGTPLEQFAEAVRQFEDALNRLKYVLALTFLAVMLLVLAKVWL